MAKRLDGSRCPHLTQCRQGKAYFHTKWHLDLSNRLATIHQHYRQIDNGSPKTTSDDKYRKQNVGSRFGDVSSAEIRTHRGRPLLSTFSVARPTAARSPCQPVSVLRQWWRTCFHYHRCTGFGSPSRSTTSPFLRHSLPAQMHTSRIGSLVVRAPDLQLDGCKFNAGLPRCQVTTLGKLFAPMCLCRSQWFSGSMPDCGVRGRGQLCLSRQPLWCTALGMGCTSLLVPRWTQPSTLSGTVKCVLAFYLSNTNKWRWWCGW